MNESHAVSIGTTGAKKMEFCYSLAIFDKFLQNLAIFNKFFNNLFSWQILIFMAFAMIPGQTGIPSCVVTAGWLL